MIAEELFARRKAFCPLISANAEGNVGGEVDNPPHIVKMKTVGKRESDHTEQQPALDSQSKFR